MTDSLQRIGRKRLLQASVAGALVSHIAVGLGLDTGTVVLSSIAVMAFVTLVVSLRYNQYSALTYSQILCYRPGPCTIRDDIGGFATACALSVYCAAKAILTDIFDRLYLQCPLLRCH